MNIIPSTAHKTAPKAFYIPPSGPGGKWRGLMFSIEFKNGNRAAFPYAHVLRIDFDTSGIIRVNTPEAVIEMKGSSLSELYEALLDHSVRTIVEGDTIHQMPVKGEAFLISVNLSSK